MNTEWSLEELYSGLDDPAYEADAAALEQDIKTLGELVKAGQGAPETDEAVRLLLSEEHITELLEKLCRLDGVRWVRMLYCYPDRITDRLLDVMAREEKIVKYMDIPLQHVSAPLLRAMNRAGSAEKFHELIERIRAAVPDITLRTTLIAGFPGETEEQFEALCDFVAEAPFDYIGVFPYSREEGTAAAELPDQLDEDEKAERAQILRDLADAVCGPRIAERIGRPMAVLVEGAEEDGQLFGRAQCQAPEVDGVTYVSDGAIGTVVDTVIADTLLYEMEGA